MLRSRYLDINMRHSCYGNTSMTSFVQEHGRQYMPCSAKFPMTLQTEILSTETSHFLKQIVFSHVILFSVNNETVLAGD